MERTLESVAERGGYYLIREFKDDPLVHEVVEGGFEFVGCRGRYTWHEDTPEQALAEHYVRALKFFGSEAQLIMSIDHRGLCVVVGPPVGNQWDDIQNAHELLLSDRYRETNPLAIPKSVRQAFERYYEETLRAATDHCSRQ